MMSELMRYRVLGNTGMLVSCMSYGFWATFGVKDDLMDDSGVEMAKDCLRVARNAGVNLFDHAEVYGEGRAEVIFGKALKDLTKENPELWRRSDILVTTKLFWGGGVGWNGKGGLNEKGLSRKHVMEGIDLALERLQLDYVDIVFCHRPDPLTPTDTVVRAMTQIVRSGKAMCWGTSEWSAQQLTEAFYIAKEGGFEPPQVEQPQYHMFHRERFEKEYFPMFRHPYNLGTTIWSPLASGLLTGKYNDEIPEGSRLTVPGYEWLVERLKEWRESGKIDIVRKLTNYAEQNFQCSTSQLALAWCLKNKNVSTVLLGATKPHQLEDNLAALKIVDKITDKHLEEINQILGNKPDQWLMLQLRPFETI